MSAEQLLRATPGEPEPGHHLVEDEQRTVLAAQLAEPVEEAGAGDEDAHVPHHRLDDDRGDVLAPPGEERPRGCEVVVRQGQGQGGQLLRHARRVRQTQGLDAAPCLDQERIAGAVVAALELHQHLAAGEGRAPRAGRRASPRCPDEVSRTSSTAGMRWQMSSASSTSPACGAPKVVPRRVAAVTASTMAGWACPRMSGPQLPTWSTYRWPSTSVSQAPRPSRKKTGVPPTPRNARTGEFTPPGITRPGAIEQTLAAGTLDAHQNSRVSWIWSGWYFVRRPLALSAAANWAGVPVITGKVP